MSEFRINTEKAPDLFYKLRDSHCCDLSVAEWELDGRFDSVTIVIQKIGKELIFFAHIFAGIREETDDSCDCYNLTLPYEFLRNHPQDGCQLGGLYSCPQNGSLHCKIIKSNVIDFEDKHYLIRSAGPDIIFSLGEIGDLLTLSNAKKFFDDLKEFCEMLGWLLDALYAVHGQELPGDEFEVKQLAVLNNTISYIPDIFSNKLGFTVINLNRPEFSKFRNN